MALVPRADTARTLADGEEVLGRTDPAKLIELTVHIRPDGDNLAEVAEQRSLDPLDLVRRAAHAATQPAPAPAPPPGPGAGWYAALAALLGQSPAGWDLSNSPRFAGREGSAFLASSLPWLAAAASARPSYPPPAPPQPAEATPAVARPHLSRQQFADAHGAKPADFARLHMFTRQSGLRIVPEMAAYHLTLSPAARRSVDVLGTVGDVNRAFGIHLVNVRRQNGSIYHTHLGPYHVPEQYDSIIGNVFGLDNRPQLHPRFRLAPHLGGTWPSGGFWPTEVARAYGFPTNVNGSGQTIAIVEFGGGYRTRDLWRYFKDAGVPMPNVRSVGVAGGRNRPTGDPNGPDGEVLLDIQVAGAVAPGANIVVYFAPNNNRGFFKAVNTAVHDVVNKPTVLSISWGQAEASWTVRDMLALTLVFQAAERMGISVFVAAGDNGSSDGVTGRRTHVDFPASSPWAIGCGGTTLLTDAGGIRERVWNDGQNGGTGGGVSAVFPMPKYQAIPQVTSRVSRPMRGVPDVAGCADPNTGYKVRIDGVDTIVGGTSAVAPLWAGLTALLNQHLGYQLGFINPLLYLTNLKQGLNDVTEGDNDTTGQLAGLFQAAPGWDPCTGFGSPNGPGILSRLGGGAV